jgi:NADH dehydrogenase
VVPLVRGGATLQQPIDADDVIAALLAALGRADLGGGVIELGGPESLPHRALVRRAAALYGREPRILPVPRWLLHGFAALAERALADPPLTPAMLGVLEHDDAIDPGPAQARLGLSLRPLDETLRRCVGPDAPEEEIA